MHQGQDAWWGPCGGLAPLSEQWAGGLPQPQCPLEGLPRRGYLGGQEALDITAHWARSRLLCLGLSPQGGSPWAACTGPGALCPTAPPRPWPMPLFKNRQTHWTPPGLEEDDLSRSTWRRTPPGGSLPSRPCSWVAPAPPGSPMTHSLRMPCFPWPPCQLVHFQLPLGPNYGDSEEEPVVQVALSYNCLCSRAWWA